MGGWYYDQKKLLSLLEFSNLVEVLVGQILIRQTHIRELGGVAVNTLI